MGISVTTPISEALEHTKNVLFKKATAGKWFVLGFCAFLAQLGQGGINFNFIGDFGNFNQSHTPHHGFDNIVHNTESWLPWAIMIGIIVFIIVMAIVLLFLWLGSRGSFMFLDGVVHNRAAVVKPWKEFRFLGNSLFRLKLALMLIFFGIFLVFGIIVALIVTALGSDNALFIVIPAALIFLCAVILAIIIMVCVEDFVVPIMYHRNIWASDAFQYFRHEILPGRYGSFILYFLMRFVLGIASTILVLAAGILTCCIGFIIMAIPYIGTVAMLPFPVFFRSYSLRFLEKIGPEWRIIPAAIPYTPDMSQPPITPPQPPVTP